MIVFTEADRRMLKHVVEDVMHDRMTSEDGYTEEDHKTMDKLAKLAQSPSAAVVVTGADLDREAHAMFRDIVAAELDNWVPNASQRLLYRASRIVGIEQPDPALGLPDCGPDRISHTLIHTWVAGLYVLGCVSCFRLYEA